MEYAYQATSEVGALPLLGSLIRALGKGWKVCVIVDQPTVAQYIAFQKYVRDKKQLQITTLQNIPSDFHDVSLVIVHGADSKTLTQIRTQARTTKTHCMVVVDVPDDSYDLISHFAETPLHARGIWAITGTGKGKTTSALGIGAQALLDGKKVAVVQWFKERKQSGTLTWAINEHEFPDLLLEPERFTFHPTGLGFFGSPTMDRVKGEQAYQAHRAKAYEGLQLAKKILTQGHYQTLILDELVDTVSDIVGNIPYPLIDLKDVQQLLALAAESSQTQVVVTGRRVTQHWHSYVQNSLVVTEVKHPWSAKHLGAISGLDY